MVSVTRKLTTTKEELQDQIFVFGGEITVTKGTAIALMMEAESISETSVHFYQTTRRNNPEDSHLHTSRRENLKSH
jgi:hypothetical protein